MLSRGFTIDLSQWILFVPDGRTEGQASAGGSLILLKRTVVFSLLLWGIVVLPYCVLTSRHLYADVAAMQLASVAKVRLVITDPL